MGSLKIEYEWIGNDSGPKGIVGYIKFVMLDNGKRHEATIKGAWMSELLLGREVDAVIQTDRSPLISDDFGEVFAQPLDKNSFILVRTEDLPLTNVRPGILPTFRVLEDTGFIEETHKGFDKSRVAIRYKIKKD